MPKLRSPINRNIETAVHELLDSRAESRIYIYLLRKHHARTEDIIHGTKLYPSTVRELLSKMYAEKTISREKLKTDTIGKNPFLYHAVSPIILLQRRVKTIETRLNTIAGLTRKTNGVAKYVQIVLNQGGDT